MLTCFHNRQQTVQQQQGTKWSLCVFPAKAGDTGRDKFYFFNCPIEQAVRQNNLPETCPKILKILGISYGQFVTWITWKQSNKNSDKTVETVIKQFKVSSVANALVIPHFDYASSVWSNCSATDQAHLQVLHNRLARTILSADIRTPIDDMLSSINWIRLSNRWSNHMLILTLNVLKICALTIYVINSILFIMYIHNHITRSHTSNKLIVPKCNSNSGKRTFLVELQICGIMYHHQFVLSLIIWLCTILKQMSLLHHFNYFCTPFQYYEFFVFFCIIISLVYL